MREVYETPGPVELMLQIAAGTIDIETVDRATTQIDVDEEDVRIEMRPASGGGHRILVEHKPRKAFGWRSDEVHARIELPHGATIRGETGSADLVIEGRIGSLTFQDGSGDVNVERCEGDVSIRAASGDVRVTEVTGNASFDTASGDVWVDRVGGNLSVRSASGDVHVGLADGSVQVSTASGDVNVDEVWNGRTALNSMSGDIHAGVRRGTRVWLDVTTTSGDASSDLDSADADEGTDVSLELRATTVSGDVVIDRATRTAA
jgi:DUF4097 and DUF4098 domain-containing protein YvlB